MNNTENTSSASRRITIAIDGHSSCGKSTMAKDLARRIGYIYIDSGAMYRCCTLFCIEQGLISGDGAVDEQQLQARMNEINIAFHLNPSSGRPDAYLNGVNVERQIRTMEVSAHVSPVAALPFVREAMTALQQSMGQKGGIVMDGRDIGTAVFPNAEMKVFVTASPEVRAQRRYDELRAKGEEVSFDEILQNLQERDRIDSTRAVAPLRQAPDAYVLDNSSLTIEEQNQWLLDLYHKLTN
ncbi:MAG: (d)CMP kinase [Bacteroidaceae bacterium]|nr:(d)CMP kinase [Bacteroidaceae bacterium]